MSLREILKKNDLDLYYKLEKIQDYIAKSFGDFLGVTYISAEEKTVYTGHGISHSQAIEEILDRLIPVKIKEQFKSSEIFILLCAVLLHDIGMKYERYEMEDIESIRRTHNWRSQQFIKKKYQEIGLNKEESIPVGYLAYAHRGNGTIDELDYRFPFHGENIRLKFLACLLRLGDELDISRNRAPTIMRELIQFTGKSEEHWDLLKKLDKPVIDAKDWTITIKAEIDNPLEEHQILILRTKIQKELDGIKEVFRKEGLHYDKIDYYLVKDYAGKPELSGEEIKKRIKIPFPRLNSYGYNEWSYLFFGREEEINDLAGLVLSNRVTFLTGESAVGKTSLLQAGLMPKLIANPKNPQEIVIYVRCGKDPIKSVRDQIVKEFPEYKKWDCLDFQGFLKEIGKVSEKVIIIDQLRIFLQLYRSKRKMYF